MTEILYEGVQWVEISQELSDDCNVILASICLLFQVLIQESGKLHHVDRGFRSEDFG